MEELKVLNHFLVYNQEFVFQGALSKDIYLPDARWYDISRWVTEDVIEFEPSRDGFVTKGELFYKISLFTSLESKSSLFCVTDQVRHIISLKSA